MYDMTQKELFELMNTLDKYDINYFLGYLFDDNDDEVGYELFIGDQSFTAKYDE